MADCYLCRNRYKCFKIIDKNEKCSNERTLTRINMTFTDFLCNNGFSWSYVDDYEYPDICKICPTNDGDYCRLGECGNNINNSFNLHCNIDMKNRKVTVYKD